MNFKTFAFTALAVVAGLFVFNMFTQQTITDGSGAPVGVSQTTARKPR